MLPHLCASISQGVLVGYLSVRSLNVTVTTGGDGGAVGGGGEVGGDGGCKGGGGWIGGAGGVGGIEGGNRRQLNPLAGSATPPLMVLLLPSCICTCVSV